MRKEENIKKRQVLTNDQILLWKTVWQFSAKVNIFLPYDSALYSLVFTQST